MNTVVCQAMRRETLPAALQLLTDFLADDEHYLASSSAYGDAGPQAPARALEMFLQRPELGFVWLALRDGEVLGSCVVCFAISTSRGGLVAKLDDVTVSPAAQGQGVGQAMLSALKVQLGKTGVSRIDTACHRDNRGAWRFYQRLGFVPLDEERISCLL